MKKFFIYSVSLLSLAIVSSCKQEGCTDINATNFNLQASKDDGSCNYLTKGCTDPLSETYNAAAEVSDGSCTYKGSVLFWYDQAMATTLSNASVTSLKFYVNDQLIGSSAATVYFTGEPSCGSGSASITDRVLLDRTEAIEYMVRDQSDNLLWFGIVEMKAKSCIKKKLE